MGNPILQGWDTLVLVAPILALLAIMFFGLDVRCASARRKPGIGRTFCEVDGNGCTDPDGKPWHGAPVRRVQARLIPVGGAGWGVEGNLAGALRRRATLIRDYVIEKQ